MSSLAQTIVDTAHNLLVKPARTEADLSSRFFNKATKFITLNERTIHVASTLAFSMYKDTPELAPLIKKAMRFSIDHNVGEAARKMDKTPTDTLLRALKFAEPPHNPTWIEYATESNAVKLGWLIEKKKDGLHMRAATSLSSLNHMPIYNEDTGHMIITEHGIRLADNKVEQRTPSDVWQERIVPGYTDMARTALSILLLMNSRSNILKVNEPSEDMTRLNHARVRRNKEKILTTRIVSFDVTRILSKGEKSEERAMTEMAAALVRGHFKVRETGVFFWSPYVRGAKDDADRNRIYAEKIKQERMVVTSNRPHCLPG